MVYIQARKTYKSLHALSLKKNKTFDALTFWHVVPKKKNLRSLFVPPWQFCMVIKELMNTTRINPQKQLKKEFRISRRMTTTTPPLLTAEPTKIAVLGAKKAGGTTWTNYFTSLNESVSWFNLYFCQMIFLEVKPSSILNWKLRLDW